VATTTALVDLSNVRRGDTTPSCDGYLLLRQRLLDVGYSRVRAIADSSLRFRLPARDVGHLEAAIGRGEGQMTPYAARHLIAAALEDDTITLVTNDRFRAPRGRFPGIPWNEAEDEQLSTDFLRGIPVQQLASSAGRSARSLCHRLEALGVVHRLEIADPAHRAPTA
jgi:hypothetical protein